MSGMNSAQAVRQQVYQALDELPPEGLEELARFLDFLRFKHRVGKPRVVALGGLWKGLDLDVSDEDIRALRQRVTARMLERARQDEIPG